jgi:hypothetical protein
MAASVKHWELSPGCRRPCSVPGHARNRKAYGPAHPEHWQQKHHADRNRDDSEHEGPRPSIAESDAALASNDPSHVPRTASFHKAFSSAKLACTTGEAATIQSSALVGSGPWLLKVRNEVEGERWSEPMPG